MNVDAPFRVGAVRVDITPPLGCQLSGFVAREQPSIGVSDRLMLHALYVQLGDARLLWIHADLIGLEREFVAAVKSQLEKEFGFSPVEIVLSASHTHSGPATIHLINAGDYDEPYCAGLQHQYLHAARGALHNPKPAQMVYADAACELTVDRRGQPSAHVDPLLGVLGWRRPDGTYIAVLANYAMHNVALGPENRRISGDVGGRAAALLGASLPGEPVVLWTNGACGNLDPPRLSADYAPTVAWGHQLAACALADLNAAAPAARPRLVSRERTIPIRLESLDASMVYIERFLAQLNDQPDAAAQFVAKDAQSEAIRRRMIDAGRKWRERMQARAREGQLALESPLPLHAIDFGPVTLACCGAEVFSRMAEDLRRLAGSPILVVGYANGEAGYLPPSAAYGEGGYEVDVAFLFYESLRVAQGEFEQAQDAMLQLIRTARPR